MNASSEICNNETNDIAPSCSIADRQSKDRQSKPIKYGWKNQDDLLFSEKMEILLPPADDLLYNCTCKVCTTKSCICLSKLQPCCSFCSCHKNNTCKNKYND